MIDNRLLVNAGMRFPTCKAGASLLDLDAARLPLTRELNEVTCKLCRNHYYNGTK
jgi:hypothetical protein